MQNTEAELLSCQLIDSSGIGTERGAARLPWAGGEVSSMEKVGQCIFHFSFWYTFILHCAVYFHHPPPPFFKWIQHTTIIHLNNFRLLLSHLKLFLLSFYSVFLWHNFL